jgi:hypothetical protein
VTVLHDPVQQLLGFAGLIEQAGLTAELSSAEAEQTLFVPSNEVRAPGNMVSSKHLLADAGDDVLCDGATAAVWCGTLASGHIACAVPL